jgi:tripartite-type tricarboxylate transporter receptor subunit TctC
MQSIDVPRSPPRRVFFSERSVVMLIRILFALGLLTCTLAAPAAEQGYPNRPIRMVVPQTAGGSMDTNGRALADILSRELGQNIVIDNRGGANGIIAGEMVAHAPPDGYTFFYTSNSMINNQLVKAKPPFDVLRDFEPVTNVAKMPGYLVLVNPQVPAQTFKELIELSKTSREPLRYGSGGIGNSQHLLGELINARTGTKFVHIPYKGLPITPLLANEIQVAFAAPTTVVQHIKAGRLRALAVTSTKRWSGLPDVPTTAEVIPGFIYEAAWHGMFAPAKTPRALVLRMQSEVAKAIRVPKLRELLETGGYVPLADSPEEFRRFLEGELKASREYMRIANVKPE